MEWGDKISFLIERKKEGKPAPALDRRPQLLQGLGFYFTAYQELKYDRPIGMSLGPIPWSSVVKWAELHDIHDLDDLDELHQYIRSMENASYEFEDRRNKERKA